jgi:predicted transcriptional regulator
MNNEDFNKKLLTMKVGEEVSVTSDEHMLRVLGGWVYRAFSDSGNVSVCFVPFNDESGRLEQLEKERDELRAEIERLTPHPKAFSLAEIQAKAVEDFVSSIQWRSDMEKSDLYEIVQDYANTLRKGNDNNE